MTAPSQNVMAGLKPDAIQESWCSVFPMAAAIPTATEAVTAKTVSVKIEKRAEDGSNRPDLYLTLADNFGTLNLDFCSLPTRFSLAAPTFTSVIVLIKRLKSRIRG